MPLWVVFHPESTFQDDATKSAFAQDVTSYYSGVGLPKFYVSVQFISQPANNIWVGGEKRDEKGTPPFVRIMVDHIAAKIDDSEKVRQRVTKRLDDLIRPHLGDKGYDYEVHIDETDRKLWRINGFVPPQRSSEGEALWARENKAIPYE